MSDITEELRLFVRSCTLSGNAKLISMYENFIRFIAYENMLLFCISLFYDITDWCKYDLTVSSDKFDCCEHPFVMSSA